MSNESTSHPKARTATERGLVVPEQISKNIRPSGTAKCGEETVSCSLNSIGVLSISGEPIGESEAFKATSCIACEAVCAESHTPSADEPAIVSFETAAEESTSSGCRTSEITSQCDVFWCCNAP